MRMFILCLAGSAWAGCAPGARSVHVAELATVPVILDVSRPSADDKYYLSFVPDTGHCVELADDVTAKVNGQPMDWVSRGGMVTGSGTPGACDAPMFSMPNPGSQTRTEFVIADSNASIDMVVINAFVPRGLLVASDANHSFAVGWTPQTDHLERVDSNRFAGDLFPAPADVLSHVLIGGTAQVETCTGAAACQAIFNVHPNITAVPGPIPATPPPTDPKTPCLLGPTDENKDVGEAVSTAPLHAASAFFSLASSTAQDTLWLVVSDEPGFCDAIGRGQALALSQALYLEVTGYLLTQSPPPSITVTKAWTAAYDLQCNIMPPIFTLDGPVLLNITGINTTAATGTLSFTSEWVARTVTFRAVPCPFLKLL